MSEAQADTATENTDQQDQQSGAPTVEHDWTALNDLGMTPEQIAQAVADSRKWEARAKGNHEKVKQFEAEQRQRAKDGMTADEKALAEAEERGRNSATAEAMQSTAAALMRLAIRNQGVTDAKELDQMVAEANLSAFVTDGDVDDDRILAYARRVAPAKQVTQKTGNFGLGGSTGTGRTTGKAEAEALYERLHPRK